MKRLMYLYKVIQALSLDVVAGAVIFSKFIATIYSLDVPWVVYLELGLAVWCIYTWDHLQDVRQVAFPSSFRHRFHKKFSQFLYPVLIFALLVGAGLVFLLPVQTVYMGVAVCILVLIYFAILYFYPGFYNKELLIATLYGAGVTLGPFSCLTGPVTLRMMIYPLFIIIIAFTNLLMFSEFDRKSDRKDGHPSLALKLGKRSGLLIRALLNLSILALLGTFRFGLITLSALLCFELMIIILSFIWVFRTRLAHREYYRIPGDGIFFIPLFFML